jgi:hypothetical protein
MGIDEDKCKLSVDVQVCLVEIFSVIRLEK